MTEITREPLNKKFVAIENGVEKGYLLYTEETNKNFVIDFVSVKPEFEGHGVGKKLVKAATDYAKEENLNISAVCSYAASVLKRMKL